MSPFFSRCRRSDNGHCSDLSRKKSTCKVGRPCQDWWPGYLVRKKIIAAHSRRFPKNKDGGKKESKNGAGEENRTPAISLGSLGPTIRRHPHLYKLINSNFRAFFSQGQLSVTIFLPAGEKGFSKRAIWSKKRHGYFTPPPQ